MGTTRATVLPFLDWSMIWPGSVGYDPNGAAWVSEAPQGVKLSVQQAQKSAPVLIPDRPWEEGTLNYTTVLYDAGRYRMWYNSGGSLCYAESPDGFNWTKPALGLLEHEGSRMNNMVYPKIIEGSVFRDPRGSEAERYKLVAMNAWGEYEDKIVATADLGRVVQELHAQGLSDAQIYGSHLQLKGAVMGAVSPDGLHWTDLPEPLFEHFSDTQNVVLFDEQLGKYVGYFRYGPGSLEPDGRRSITRAESDDFRHWPLPRVVLQPDCQELPTDDYYTNAYCRYPRNLPYHLMFPAIYRRLRDDMEVRLAVSRDGFNWDWPERVSLATPDPGDSGAIGGFYACPELVPLPDQRWGLLLRAEPQFHNEGYYHKATGRGGYFCWAMWRPDRLVALEAPVEGRVTLNPHQVQADRISLNYQTEPNGWIKVEIIEAALWPPAHLEPLAGYAFADCEPLRGDSLEGELRWQNSADIAALRGRRICLRIELYRARLFSVSM